MWCCAVWQQFQTFRAPGTTVQQHFLSQKTRIFRFRSDLTWISQSVKNVTKSGSHSYEEHVWRVTCDVGRPALLSAISTQRRNRRCDQNVVTGQSLSSLLQVCRWFGSNEYKITQHYAECTAETARTAASKCQLIYNNPVLLISYLPLSQCRSLSAAWIPNGHRQTVHPIMNLPARNLLAVLYEPHRPPSRTLHDRDFELSWS